MSVLPAAAEAQACESVPVLGDLTVNQGLGSYSPLVRGKETLVRLYLALSPSCGRTLTTLAGRTSLTVLRGGVVVAGDIKPYASAAELGQIGSTQISNSTPADPIFVIPASVLRPAPETEPFTITLRATVEYRQGTNTPARTVTFTSLSATPNTPITAQFNRFSHILRVLAVPMGNASQAYGDQFTSRTADTLSTAMRTVSRIYPVPEGVGSLGPTPSGTPPPGIKYSVNPTMVHVGTLPWCGTSANLAGVSTDLLNALRDWNSRNTDAQADVALGVIDGTLSGTGATGCSDGMASINTPVAWARLVAGTETTPSQAGALIAMELSHTTALVPDLWGSGWHSRRTDADFTSPNRAYNIDTRSYIGEDRTVTRIYPPWNNNNTVFEKLDWGYEVCKLTPQGVTSEACPIAGEVGSPNSSHSLMVMTGRTDGTRPGTRVDESYVAANGSVPSLLDETSPYRLLQKANGVVRLNDGVVVSSESSAHGSPVGPGQPGLFSVATRFAADATSIELVNTRTTPPTVLYSADRNLKPTGEDNPPVVIDIEAMPGPPKNLTRSDGTEDRGPALSDDGRMLAWVADSELANEVRPLYVALADEPSVRAAVPGCNTCLDPAWSSDGRALAFVRDTEAGPQILSMIEVDPTRAPNDPLFFRAAAPTALYTSNSVTEVISRPTWSPGDARSATTSIAFQAATTNVFTSRIQAIDLGTPTEAYDLTPPGETASMPSWSHTPGDNRLVYVQRDDLRGECSDCNLVALDPGHGTTQVLVTGRDVTFAAPSWGTDGHIVFAQIGADTTSSLWRTEARPGGPSTQLTSGMADREPSLAGTRVAFERPGSGDGNPPDLYLLDVRGRIEVGAMSTSVPPDPTELRVDLYLSCGPSSVEYPIASALTPDATSGASGTFGFNYDTSLTCGSDAPASGATLAAGGSGGPTTPTVRALVSDGFLRSVPSPAVPIGSAPKRPTMAISSPTEVGTDHVGAYPFLEQTVLRLIGSGRDAEDGELGDDALEWFLDGARVATGTEVDLPSPSPGRHTLVLRGRDSDGNVDEARRTLDVAADADRDGIPATAETCSSDADPLDAFADSDGDGLTNIDDYATTGEPCRPTTDFSVPAAFDPEVLNPSSSGRFVTVTLERAPRSWSEIDPATVRLELPGAFGCAPLELGVSANGWQAGADQATAKFDRQAIVGHLVDNCHLREQRVPFSVTGTSRPQHGPWTFEARDDFYLS